MSSLAKRSVLLSGHATSVALEPEFWAVLDAIGAELNPRRAVPNAQIDPRHTYAVRAEIRDPAGALRFTTDTRHSVLTNGAPNKADIIMVGVR